MHARRLVVLLSSAALLAAPLAAAGPAAAATGDVLFVVAAPTALTAGESAVRSRLLGGGYTVTVADDDTVATAQTAGKAFVLVGQSSSSNAPTVKALAAVAVPVWVAKPYLFPTFGLTKGIATTDYGDKAASTITIATAGHPMAAGRTGTVTLQSGGRLSYGKPTASATVVAVSGVDAVAFTVAPGAALASGAMAPACRLTFPLFTTGPTTFTADAWAMFDATAAWATANCTAGPPPVDQPPTVGVTAPTAGSTVSGTVALSANTTDDHGVTAVAFAVDGAAAGTDTAAPFTVSWDSGTVAAGGHSVTATATDTFGHVVTSAPVSFTVATAPPAPSQVLFVVAAPTALTAGESAVRARLVAHGYTVTVADDDTVTTAQATGKAFVLVAQSSSSNAPTVKALASVSVPVWVAKPYLFPSFGLTGTVATTDYGDKAGSQLTIADPASPLAAGRAGTVTIQSGGRISYGRPAAAASVVARNGTDAVVFWLAAGARLATGTATAPGCRLTFPLFTTGPTTFTVDGWAMFDATVTWAAASCSAGPPPEPPTGVATHVVLVSVDGLNPDAIRQLGPAGAPTFARLAAEGTSTLNARTLYDATQTLPDHTGQLTGRPVDGVGGTHVTFNEDNGSTVHVSAGTYVHSIFDVVHDNGGRTALYTGKAKFDFFDRSWNSTYGGLDTVGADNGRDKIDTYLRTDDETTTDLLVANLTGATPNAFSMIHYPGPDQVGHAQGYMSAAYVAEVAATDGLIDRLLDAIAGNPTLAETTTVIVTSDHGGLGFSHADETLAVNYTIPMFVWGAGVTAGTDLYALNADRADPGTGRPAYSGPQPVRNAEAGNLAAELLGYTGIPGSLINADESLDVAAP